MKFIISQSDFAKALQIIFRSVAQKPHLPILSNILLEANKNGIKMQATNLEIGTTIEVKTDVKKEGKLTIPAKIINEFVSSLPGGEITFEEKDNSVSLSLRKFQARISTTSTEEFPVVPTSNKEADISFEGEFLAKALDQVVFSAAAEEGRPVLSGVLFDLSGSKLKLVATDGYRLSYRELDTNSKLKFKVIIPAKSLFEVRRVISEIGPKEKIQILLARDQNQVIFKIANVEIVSRLIEGEFPDWEKIIPKEFITKSTIDCDEFAKAIKVSSVFARDSSNVIKLKIEPKSIILSANTKEVGDNVSEIDGQTTGDGGEIAFNFRYLSDILSAVNTKEVIFEMAGPLSAGLFRPQDQKSKEFFHIIMPVRVQV